MKSILVCDDHPLIVSAWEGMLRSTWPEARIEVARDFASAFELAPRGFEVALVDLTMPGAEPLPGIQRLRELAPDMRVLVVSALTDDETILRLLALGVRGFAPKTENIRVLEAALRLIMAGGRYLPDSIVTLAASRQSPAPGVENNAPAEAGAAKLSSRQLDVLRLLAQGTSNKEIARVLLLSPSTVKTHIAHMQMLLRATRREDVVAAARERGLI